MDKLVIITGPTGVGKTGLSLPLCKKYKGEVISADSMQIYKGLNIGTDKVDLTKTDIPHYMVDIINPEDNYSVAEFKTEAQRRIKEINHRDKIPFVVGGTGLYINSLVYDLDFSLKSDPKLRIQLENQMKDLGLQKMYQKLKKIRPDIAAKVDPNNKNRVLRALEIEFMGGKTKTGNFRKETTNYQLAFIGLNMDRKKLYQRINDRVEEMLERGLIEEVEFLLASGLTKDHQSMKAIGYKEVIEYLKGNVNYDDMVFQLKRNSRRYAKRQLTWFRRDQRIHWFDRENPNVLDEVTTFINAKLKEIPFDHE
ncbi:MAG: tRNA (adenosine(37)-N6)-dimethylallyltransferase MiaA [Tissierellia bacterium]|nr:tRNA (adenosine(37)-N6)-dimethylallyltransferase MiaA [Tissierellia bacterium]